MACVLYRRHAAAPRPGFEGMRVAVSGSGNVAQYTIEKALELDARVITVSDSGGTSWTKTASPPRSWRTRRRSKPTLRPGGGLRPRTRPDVSGGPAAVERAGGYRPAVRHPERTGSEAALTLIRNGVKAVAEGANMPTTPSATDAFLDAGVLFAPAGG